MLAIDWTKFVHPAGVYRLEYPSHWDQITKDDGSSCGFGPHDRDDVGLWISLMPVSVDTDRLAEELPKILGQVLPHMQGGNLSRDPSLHHYGVKADMHKEGEGGHYWLIAGGDVVLFASSQVPAAERDVWNPTFERLMSTLVITRDEELAFRQLTNEVLAQLRQRQPEQDFRLDENGIRGNDRVVYLSNLHREVLRGPRASGGTHPAFREESEPIHGSADGGGNLGRGGGPPAPPVEAEQLHRVGCPRPELRRHGMARRRGDLLRPPEQGDFPAREHLRRGPLADGCPGPPPGGPREPEPASLADQAGRGAERDGGRVIVVATEDGLASSRLLHPDLHRLFKGPLGSPFRAGIPDRGTLVLYSDRRRLRQRIERQLHKDHQTSGYPITARPFLVTPDGIAPAKT